MPLELIDKKDNWELIRDEIASILAVETVNQQAKADDAGKNPELWKFRVFIERSRPWEMLSETDIALTPIVNVWFDTLSFDPSASSTTSPQQSDGTIYNIDILAAAVTEKSLGDGHKSADKTATLDCQRIVRLVRNILFSIPANSQAPGDNYYFLNLPGVVGGRRIQAINSFQADHDKHALGVAAARIVFAVRHIETSLEGPYEDFELLQMQTVFNETGEVNYEIDLTI